MDDFQHHARRRRLEAEAAETWRFQCRRFRARILLEQFDAESIQAHGHSQVLAVRGLGAVILVDHELHPDQQSEEIARCFEQLADQEAGHPMPTGQPSRGSSVTV